jgi:hypothetical protein
MINPLKLFERIDLFYTGVNALLTCDVIQTVFLPLM